MNWEKFTICLAIWMALVCQALAHPPYVEPWKLTANLSISGLVGVCAGVVARKKLGLVAAVVVGGLVLILCGAAGFLISIVASM